MSLNIYEGLSIDNMLQDGKYTADKENHTAKYVEVSTVDDFIALKNHLALGDLPERFRQLDDVLKESMNFVKVSSSISENLLLALMFKKIVFIPGKSLSKSRRSNHNTPCTCPAPLN